MPTWQLTIQIDNPGLRALSQSGQKVALVKSTSHARYAVVWLTAVPSQTINIGWKGDYRVYAATTALSPGGVIGEPIATGTALAGNIYTLSGGSFDGGRSGAGAAVVGVRNQDEEVKIGQTAMIVGGVQEAATVNSQSVWGFLDAQQVLYNERAFCDLSEQVLVFPAAGAQTGTLLDQSWLQNSGAFTDDVTVGVPLSLDMTSSGGDRTIHFDDETYSFVTGPSD